ncbi:hypothetical protein L1987_02386 [Smallanthus sonchifolius]|uniref:Uncharacterized protein n=1 Tax=Smallanthus sonchifolius TaxID=185202 RepID=A0ACB9K7L9_9ASTR|nr:hypothetical protein L1987_02386 [Smallanthus sonchifolius]
MKQAIHMRMVSQNIEESSHMLHHFLFSLSLGILIPFLNSILISQIGPFQIGDWLRVVLVGLFQFGNYSKRKNIRCYKEVGGTYTCNSLSKTKAGGYVIGEREIDALLIQPGDLLKIIPSSKVPVDGLVVSGSSYVNESMVTGESAPVLRRLILH